MGVSVVGQVKEKGGMQDGSDATGECSWGLGAMREGEWIGYDK